MCSRPPHKRAPLAIALSLAVCAGLGVGAETVSAQSSSPFGGGATLGTERGGAWFTDVELVAAAPLGVSGRLVVESPSRVRVGGEVGGLPGPWVGGIAGVAASVGELDAEQEAAIRSGATRTLTARLDLGWRPWAAYGFYAQVGYRYVRFGGVLTGEEAFEALDLDDNAEVEVPPELVFLYGYDVESRLHLVDVEVGWLWRLPGSVLVRLGVGFAGHLGSEVEAEPLELADLYAAEIVSTLEDVYGRYAYMPTVSLGVGYRFR